MSLSRPSPFYPPGGGGGSNVSTIGTRSAAPRNFGLILGIGGASCLAAYLVYSYWLKQKELLALQGNYFTVEEAPKIILIQCPRGFTVPSISPFSLNLETFLRISSIPYEVRLASTVEDQMDVDEADPWMIVGTEPVAIPSNCTSKLIEVFKLDFENEVSISRTSASQLVRIALENHLYWAINLWRWVFDKGESLSLVQPLTPNPTTINKVAEYIKHASSFSDFSGLSLEQVYEQLAKDLKALSTALGKQSYFNGNVPGEIDCTAFGMLAQVLWSMPDNPFEPELRRHQNLIDFVLRMKENYWHDWNEILAKPEDFHVKLDEKRIEYPIWEFDVVNRTLIDPQQRLTTKETLESVSASSSKSRTKFFMGEDRGRRRERSESGSRSVSPMGIINQLKGSYENLSIASSKIREDIERVNAVNETDDDPVTGSNIVTKLKSVHDVISELNKNLGRNMSTKSLSSQKQHEKQLIALTELQMFLDDLKNMSINNDLGNEQTLAKASVLLNNNQFNTAQSTHGNTFSSNNSTTANSVQEVFHQDQNASKYQGVPSQHPHPMQYQAPSRLAYPMQVQHQAPIYYAPVQGSRLDLYSQNIPQYTPVYYGQASTPINASFLHHGIGNTIRTSYSSPAGSPHLAAARISQAATFQPPQPTIIRK